MNTSEMVQYKVIPHTDCIDGWEVKWPMALPMVCEYSPMITGLFVVSAMTVSYAGVG
jgi:hypothetical protein